MSSSPASPAKDDGRHSRHSSPLLSPNTKYKRFMKEVGGAVSGDESSSEEDIVRPTGKMAARMQAGSRSARQEADVDDDDDDNHNHNDETGDTVTARSRSLTARPTPRSSTPEVTAKDPEPASSPLFVSPAKHALGPADAGSDNGDADADLPSTAALAKNARLRALIAKKAKEREAEERKKAEARQQAEEAFEEDIEGDEAPDDFTDDEGGLKLTTEVLRDGKATRKKRPASRKASKKALEEMNRETQRMSRAMQLAHEPRTKKQISKATLFERFNFRQAGEVAGAKAPAGAATAPVSSSRPTTPGVGDVEMRETTAAKEEEPTPPTSPPTGEEDRDPSNATVPARAASPGSDMEEGEKGHSPALDVLVARKRAKGKGKATTADFEAEERQQQLQEQQLQQRQAKEQEPAKPRRQIRVKLPLVRVNTVGFDNDDDDDLIVQPTRLSTIDAIFDRVPASKAREPRPLHVLRRLAHIDDPEKLATSAPNKSATPAQKRQDAESAMTAAELAQSLILQARQQAKVERERQLESLREKGVYVQTQQEREAEMEAVEDIVARERRKAEDIMEKEREEDRRERKNRKRDGDGEGGAANDLLAWDDSDEEDGDCDGEREEAIDSEAREEEAGREQEDGDEEELEDEGEDEGAASAGEDMFVDGAAEESDNNKDEPVADADSEDDDEIISLRPAVRRKPKKQVAVLSDDEEDGVEPTATTQTLMVEATPKPKPGTISATTADSPSVTMKNKTNIGTSPNVPTPVLRSATKSFIPGLPVPAAGPAGMGLTQIFAGTMDDSQPGTAAFTSPSQPKPTFDPFLGSQFSQTVQHLEPRIPDSQQPQQTTSKDQESETQDGVRLDLSQSQTHGLDSLLQQDMNTPPSQLPFLEPTQDGGFQDFSPLRQRFVEPPHSTIETVPVSMTQPVQSKDQAGQQGIRQQEGVESPLVKKAGRLRRKADMVADSATTSTPGVIAASDAALDNEGDPMEGVETDEFGFGTVAASKPKDPSAFNVMRDTAAQQQAALKKAAQAAFDKKKSKARDMIEEQAEESEDEYAGLGGADGEDSEDEEDAQLAVEMIDDEHRGDAHEEGEKLAAFYAERERAADDKQVEKLFHDITTGMLRRKRAAGGDPRNGLWDSDDDSGGEERRRRAKRRKFAKMQRALLADERVSKVAENPRANAFLRTIEDRVSDDDDGGDGAMDFLFAPKEEKGTKGTKREQKTGRPGSSSSAVTAGTVATIPNSQPQGAGGAEAAAAGGDTIISRRNPRRTAWDPARKKPTTMSEIRATLSNLLDNPSPAGGPFSSVIPATEDGGSDREEPDDGEQYEDDPDGSGSGSSKENLPPITRPPRYHGKNNGRSQRGLVVVDRLAEKQRQASETDSAENAGNASAGRARQAFTSAGGGGSGSFSASGRKGVPALLRRATTNSSMVAATSSLSSASASAPASSSTATPKPIAAAAKGAGGNSDTTTTTNSNSGGGGNSHSTFGDASRMVVKKGATKTSGINHFARESERQAHAAEARKRREARRLRGAEGRADAVGGLFGAGQFE